MPLLPSSTSYMRMLAVRMGLYCCTGSAVAAAAVPPVDAVPHMRTGRLLLASPSADNVGGAVVPSAPPPRDRVPIVPLKRQPAAGGAGATPERFSNRFGIPCNFLNARPSDCVRHTRHMYVCARQLQVSTCVPVSLVAHALTQSCSAACQPSLTAWLCA